MLLTITSTRPPATDLGHLLAKNPAHAQTFPLPFGQVHVCYPEATPERCTAALLLDVDPVALSRGRPGVSDLHLQPYVNDRPYVASSFLSVAIAQVYRTALAGRSRERQALADTAQTWEARLAMLPCRGGESLLRRLFEPLGYAVEARREPLDPRFPDWGESRCYDVTLRVDARLRDLLSHLYVLVPVLDDEKHYWVDDAEVAKLLRHGEGWLAGHPERALIADRYLLHQRRLARAALARLLEAEEDDPSVEGEGRADEEAAVERPLSLNEQRQGTVVSALKSVGARRVLDLGCGEGRLLQVLLADREFTELVGVDVSVRTLERARERLRLDRLPERQRQRVSLVQGALTYRDARLAGYDAAAVVEVIEHLDPSRLPAFERALFEFARPGAVVVTTPNVEYNVRFATLPAGRLRHRDHRFEWTRAEFRAWAERVASQHGYGARFLPVGAVDPELGPPTQMGLFVRAETAG